MADQKVTITPRLDGPYRVEGPIKLVDVDGNEFEVTGDEIFLCRCGDSSSKPFCDGTHKKIGFKGQTKAKSRPKD